MIFILLSQMTFAKLSQTLTKEGETFNLQVSKNIHHQGATFFCYIIYASKLFAEMWKVRYHKNFTSIHKTFSQETPKRNHNGAYSETKIF